MKIALIGYGKMGREIEKTLLERYHEVTLKIDIDNLHDFSLQNLGNADVAIDFSTPDSAFNNIIKCFEAGIPIVCGTTGWLNKYDEVIKICREQNGTFFYAPNYSIGVNLFFKLNNYLAGLMNKYNEYNVEIEEIHHVHKLDAPSGTAISLAEGIINKLDRKENWKLNESKEKNTLCIQAKRENEVPGIHKIKYHSDVDYIEIAHTAKSRKGLAYGAVLAAEFISDKKGVFSMEDIMKTD
ncbi:MAG: 4-hydroxy-tetrahydrodipicolinate reductase [Bacteroidales bacterium]|nr:4-hydroxy-tetrahydrodipicolinate reductase [Bacteroidales bacterium]